MPPDPDPDPDRELRFDPTDPHDLARLCEHLHRRAGRTFHIPQPFEVPEDATDPNAPDGWAVYPEDPCIRHFDPATRTVVDVSFPGDDRFRIYGWVWERHPPTCRVLDCTGRFHRCGASELTEGLAALLYRLLTGEPSDTPAGDTP